MEFAPLPFDSGLEAYDAQALALHKAYQKRDQQALGWYKERHPRFLDPEIRWLALNPPDSEVAAAGLTIDDARLVIARCYDFRDWASLAGYASEAGQPGSPVYRFEAAVEAVIGGDVHSLARMLESDAELVRARSTRLNNSDPPAHSATLLHYLAANGVEGYRQKSPANAVEVARLLLEQGADPDSLASMYGGQCTTLSLLVSSTPPAEAGVQIPLVEVLVDFGATVEPHREGNWRSPLLTALVFGFRQTAEALVRRGARVNTIEAAAGLGRTDAVREMLTAATDGQRHRALALAAQLGQVEAVRLLLDAGEDPDRFNPEGFHSHATPLHQAALAGHLEVVRLLVGRGARVDVPDRIYRSTPLGWAQHGCQDEVERYLRSRQSYDQS